MGKYQDICAISLEWIIFDGYCRWKLSSGNLYTFIRIAFSPFSASSWISTPWLFSLNLQYAVYHLPRLFTDSSLPLVCHFTLSWSFSFINATLCNFFALNFIWDNVIKPSSIALLFPVRVLIALQHHPWRLAAGCTKSVALCTAIPTSTRWLAS
jgi:hypothetical protein